MSVYTKIARHKRALALLIALVMVSGLLISCGKGKDGKGNDKELTTTVNALSNDPIASGGKAIDKANAKELSIQPEGDTVTLALRFVLGSQQQGIDEAESDGVPSYRAYWLPSPSRFVLEFDNLSYWDFMQTVSFEESDPFFYGVFNQIQLQSSQADINPSAFRIVFQLRQNVEANVSDKGDTITIALTKSETPTATSYHIMSTEMPAYNTGRLKQSVGFFPTLSNDLTNQVILSQPYAQESEAQSALDTLLSENADFLNAQNTFIVAIDGSSLPGYTDNADFHSVYEQFVIRRGSTSEKLPVVMPDGIYLCSTSDNLLSLFSKQIYDEDANTQELWTLDSAGNLKRLTDIEFADIASAAFSPDGKKLGLIERTADSSYLYVYDLYTNELDSLSEAGLGNTVSTFVWDTLGTAIYSIAGIDNKQQLLKYDFTVADEDLRITSVDENEIGEGDLAFYNGELYFTNVTENDEEQVFHIRPEGGLRTPFTVGGSFRLSQDGQYMAILRSDLASADSDEELGGQTALVLRNMATQEETAIVSDAFVVTYAWSTDGLLYYTESISGDFSDEFSYRFVRYDPRTNEKRALCDFVSSDFAAAPDANIIYIPMIRDEEGATPIHATYRLRLDALLPGELITGSARAAESLAAPAEQESGEEIDTDTNAATEEPSTAPVPEESSVPETTDDEVTDFDDRDEPSSESEPADSSASEEESDGTLEEISEPEE